jgi:hypothetical protein
LGLLNHETADEFAAQVIGIIDPMGRMIGPQHWVIPWLEDNSADPKRIFVGQTRMLNFARYDAVAVHVELSSRKDGICHCWFSSLPTPIGARYYNPRCQEDLEEQHFTLIVRVMSATSEKYLDGRLRVGVRGSELTCELVSSSVPK